MTHVALSKTLQGFMPADEPTREVYGKMKLGEVLHGDFKKMRNARFHRKLFALLNLAYEYWQPGEIDSQHGTPEKNFDRFRRDLIILAGFYDVVIRLDGTTRIEAKSISFANMDDAEFEKLYNAILNVILKKIDTLKDMTADEVNRLVDEVLRFA